METIVFDGHNLAIRCSRAPTLRGLVDEKGRSTSEAFGVLHALATFHKRYIGAKLLVVWEGSSNFRRSLFSGYKKNRADASNAFGIQFLKDHLASFGIEQACQPEEEADDVVASILGESACEEDRFVLVTTDRDYWQLVSERTSLLVPPAKSGGEEKVYGPTAIASEFGVRPEQMVDVRALAGDESDDIPGAPGFGLKHASKAIRLYGSVDGLYASDMKKLTKDQRARLALAEAQVRLNVQLMRLRTVAAIQRTAAAAGQGAAERALLSIGADPAPLLAAFFPRQMSLLS